MTTLQEKKKRVRERAADKGSALPWCCLTSPEAQEVASGQAGETQVERVRQQEAD